MKVDKKIKELPWPEEYRDGNQDFKVTLQWPVIDHERLLVATFVRNRNKKTWRTPGKDFRVICSKKNGTMAILVKSSNVPKRKNLREMLDTFGTGPVYCYPEIAPKDEQALGKWLGNKPAESKNHLIPELEEWICQAISAEILRERDARGELRDEDVLLCPDEIPAGLVEHIRTNVLPQDDVLLYKKGNVRGTCFLCRQKVKADFVSQRFRQGERTTCPNCGRKVYAILENGDTFRADYVEDVATIQKGSDGKTLFVRQWHLVRDKSAEWKDIPAQLEEVARYAVRGNRAAKWQHEVKERWSMFRTIRSRLNAWVRTDSVAAAYDGQYFFYLPPDWKTQVAGTSLQYCDLAEYHRNAQEGKKDRNTIRFIMDWARYPMVEKLWKAGYTGLVHERLRGMNKEHRNALIWTKQTIRDAIRFPQRLLKLWPPEEWTISRMQRVSNAWQMVQKGQIRENEIETLVNARFNAECISAALGHASVFRIVSYLEKRISQEEKNRANPRAYYYAHQAPSTYRDYLNDCMKLGWNLDDKSILFPPDLDAAHARTIEQVKYKQSEITREQFRKTREKQLWMEWECNGLLIRLPEDGAEIIAEGKKLKHCVGGYVNRAAEGKTTILFIRRVDDPDTPYFTLEWLDDHVQQCRSLRNRDYHEEKTVQSFVDAWVKRIESLRRKKKKEKAA